MTTFEKDIQYRLNKIMELFEHEDELYSPKLRLSFMVRDFDQKRVMKYEYNSDIFQSIIEAKKYSDSISKKL